MNKIFRVIWNSSTQTWMAVSELAKGRVKSSSSSQQAEQPEQGEGLAFKSAVVFGNVLAVAAPVVIGGVLLAPSQAEAANSFEATYTTGGLGKKPVSIETNSTASSGIGNILIGATATISGRKKLPKNFDPSQQAESYLNSDSANAEETRRVNTSGGSGLAISTLYPTMLGPANEPTKQAAFNIVIGEEASSPGRRNIVLGYEARGWQSNSNQGASRDQIVIGTQAVGAATRGVVIGTQSFAASEDSIAIGTRVLTDNAAFRAVALGYEAIVGNTRDGKNYRPQDAVSIGTRAQVYACYSVALGFNATSYGTSSLAVGQDSLNNNADSTTVGARTYTNSSFATALGAQSKVKEYSNYSMALGFDAKVNENSANSTVVGSFAEVNKSTYSTALGSQAKVNENSDYSAALGFAASVNRDSRYSVSIGHRAETTGASTIAMGNRAAAGAENATSLGSYSNASAVNSTAVGASAASGGANSFAGGYNARSRGPSTVALGDSALAEANQGIAIGKNSKAGANTGASDNIALGNNSNAANSLSIAIGSSANANALKAISIGHAANTSGASGSIAIGDSANANNNDAIAIGTGAQASMTGHASAIAIGKSSYSVHDSVALGQKARAETLHATAVGDEANATGFAATALGAKAKTSNGTAVALGFQANASHDNSVALGANSTTSAVNTGDEAKFFTANDKNGTAQNTNYAGLADAAKGSVSFGSAGKERQLHHVAAGRISSTSTDAINGSQLYAVATTLGFNVQENGAKRSRVNNDNIVNFVNGTYSTAVVTPAGDGKSSTVTFNVVKQAIPEPNEASEITAPAGTEGVATAADVVKAINKAGWKTTAAAADGGEVEGATNENITTGETVVYKAGKNLKVKQEGNNFTFSTKNDVTFNSVAITNGPTLNANGIQMGDKKITGLANGTDPNDAVNKSQLDNAGFVVEREWKEAAPNQNPRATVSTVKNNHKLNFKEGTYTSVTATHDPNENRTNIVIDVAHSDLNNDQNTGVVSALGSNLAGHPTGLVTGASVATAINTAVAKSGFLLKINEEADADAEKINPNDNVTIKAGKNINVTRSKGDITINTSDTPEFTSVAITNGPTLNADGINMNGDKITGLKAGEADTDAVNKSQLDAATAGWKIGDDKDSTTTEKATIGAGKRVDFVGEDNVEVTVDPVTDKGAVVKVKAKTTELTVSDGTPTTPADPANPTVPKGKVKTPTDETGLVTAKSVADAINNSGWNIGNSDDGSAAENATVSAGKRVDFVGKENVDVTVLKVDDNRSKVEVKAKTYDITSNVGTNGKITDAPTDKAGNLVSAGNVLSALKNLGLLVTSEIDGGEFATSGHTKADKKVGSGETVTFKAGKNLTVKQDGANFTFATSLTPDFTSVTITNGPTLNADGINMNGDKITGLANGTDPNDAVNKSQLDAVKETASKGWNLNATATNGGETYADHQTGAQNIAPDAEVEFVADKNIKIKREGNKIFLTTTDNVSFNEVNSSTVNVNTTFNATGANVTVGGNTDPTNTNSPNTTFKVLDNTNIDFGGNKITNVSKGVADTDVATIENLKEFNTTLVNTGLNFRGNVPTVTDNFFHSKLGSFINILGGVRDDTVAGSGFDSKNLRTRIATNATGAPEIVVEMTENPEFNTVNATTVNATTVNVKPGGELNATGANVTVGGKTDPADNNSPNSKFTVKPNTDIDFGDNKITNVANGTAAGDAVNKSQLDAATAGWEVGNNDGDQVGNNITATNPRVNFVDSKTVTANVSAISNGANVSFDVKTTALEVAEADIPAVPNPVDPTTPTTPAIPKGKVKAPTDNDALVTAKSVADAINNAGWVANATATVDGEVVNNTPNEKISAGDVVTFEADKNIKLTQDGKKFTIATKENVTFNQVNATTVNVNAGGELNATGANTVIGGKQPAVNGAPAVNSKFTVLDNTDISLGNNTLTNVGSAGTINKDNKNAVNGADLFNYVDKFTNNSLKFKGNANTTGVVETADGNVLNRSLAMDTPLEIVGTGTKTNDNYSGENIKTITTDKGIEIRMDKNANFTSVTADKFETRPGGNVTIGGEIPADPNVAGAKPTNSTFNVGKGTNINFGGNKINNVANGSVSADSKEVVNGSQLHELKESPLTFTGNSGKTERKLGTTLNITGTGEGADADYSGKNVRTVVTGPTDDNPEGRVEIRISEKPKFNNVTVGNKVEINADGINMGGTKITGVKDGNIGPGSTDAVNGGQIFALVGDKAAPNINPSYNTTVTNPDGKTTTIENKNVVMAPPKEGEDPVPILTTYNVQGQKEHVTNSVLTAIYNMNKEGIKYFHVNDGEARSRPEDQAENTQDSSASGASSAAIGRKAVAAGANSVALGVHSHAEGYKVASVSYDDNGNVTVTYSADKQKISNTVAIGNGAVAGNNNTISIGTRNVVTGENSGAIGDPSIIDGDNSYSVGNNNEVAADKSDVFVLGNSVTAVESNSIFLGTKSGYVGPTKDNADSTRTRGNATTYTKHEIDGTTYNFAGGDQVVGVLSVGNATETRRIQNVAPGLLGAESTDAINGSQLYAVMEAGWTLASGAVAGSTGVITHNDNQGVKTSAIGIGKTMTVNAGNNIEITHNAKDRSLNIATSMTPTFNSLKINPGGTVDMGGNRIQNVGKAVNPGDALSYGQFKAELGEVDRDLRAGIAGATAMSFLQRANEPGKSLVSVAVGGYRGEGALAVGYSRNSDNNKISIKLGVGVNSRSDLSYGGSIGYQW